MATFDNIRKLMKMSKEERDVLAQPSVMDEVPTDPEQDELIKLLQGQRQAIENSLTTPTAGVVSKLQAPKNLDNIKKDILDIISKSRKLTPTSKQDDAARAFLENEINLFSNPNIKSQVITPDVIAPMNVKSYLKKR